MTEDVNPPLNNQKQKQFSPNTLPDIGKTNRIVEKVIEPVIKWQNVDYDADMGEVLCKKLGKSQKRCSRRSRFIGKHSKANSSAMKTPSAKVLCDKQRESSVKNSLSLAGFFDVVEANDSFGKIGERLSSNKRSAMKSVSYESSDPVNLTPNFESRLDEIVSDFGSEIGSLKTGKKKVVAGYYVPYVQEISEKPYGQTVVSLYIKEKILKQPSIHQTEETEYLRELYENCIENEWQIKKAILKDPLSFAKELVDQFKEGEEEEKLKTLDEFDDRDLFFRTSLNTHCKGPIDEIANDVNSAENFYIPFIEFRLKDILPNKVLSEATQRKVIETYLDRWFLLLQANASQPSSHIRLHFLNVLAVAEINSQVCAYLVSKANVWLECVCQCLLCPFSSVRDEASIIIACLSMNNKLLTSLQNTYVTDYVADMAEALINAMEKHEESFPIFYTTLGYFLHNTTYTSLLKVLIDLGCNCQCHEMSTRWPKLISYAFKYWKPSIFLSTPGNVQKFLYSLENAYMQPLCRKAAKKAICEMSHSLKCKPLLITYYFSEKP